ncbi:hypothetical protein ACFIOY_35270 [Bradyrhizobium sp. TZ2]
MKTSHKIGASKAAVIAATVVFLADGSSRQLRQRHQQRDGQDEQHCFDIRHRPHGAALEPVNDDTSRCRLSPSPDGLRASPRYRERDGAAPVRATVNELLTIWVRDWQRERPAPREELMDTPTSAAPDKTPPPDLALGKEKSKLSGQLEMSAERFNSSVARLTSNSIGELQGLVSELQKMQEFLTSEVDSVQRQIDSALGGINIIVETIGPWKNIASSQTLPSGTRNVRAGGLAAHIEQRIRG